MLNIPEVFKTHIQNSNTTIYPLVIIGEENTENNINISTVKESIKLSSESSEFYRFEDYNLKISNLKDSIDIKSHSLKTSNLTLTLNNYTKLSDNNLLRINVPVQVYYKSVMSKYLSDCVLIYSGKIKAIEHDELNIRITLEDVSLDLNVDIPYANLGYSENVYNKNYINRYIPITYGQVDKAPIIPYLDKTGISGQNKISFLADDIDVVTRQGFSAENKRNILIDGFWDNVTDNHYSNFGNYDLEDSSNPLYIYKDDYFRVLSNFKGKAAYDDIIYDDNTQYEIDDGFLSMEKRYINSFPQNPPAMNELQALKIIRPNEFKLLESDDEGNTVESGSVQNVVEINPFQGILRPEAAIDSNDNPSSIMSQTGNINEFSTFSEIPNSQPTLAFIPEYTSLNVNEFTPYNGNISSTYGTGFHYQENNVERNLNFNTNYLFNAMSWTAAHAHELPVRFIKMPTSTKIIARADLRLFQKGYRLNVDGENAQGEQISDSGGAFISCYASNGKKAEIVQQFSLDTSFRDAYMLGGGLDPNQEYPAHFDVPEGYDSLNNNFNNGYSIPSLCYFPREGTYYSNPDSPRPQFNLDSNGTFTPTTDELLAGEDSIILNNDDASNSYWGDFVCRAQNYSITNPELGQFSLFAKGQLNNDQMFANSEFENLPYPSFVFKMWCDSQSDNSNNLQDIKRVYVGQYIPSSMPPYSQIIADGNVWFNIIQDPNNPDIPFLWEYADDFVQFKPDNVNSKSYNTLEEKYDIKFSAAWNGASDNNDVLYEGGSEWIEDKIMPNHFGLFSGIGGDRVSSGFAKNNILKQKDAFGNNAGWFIYTEEDIDSNSILNNTVDNLGEYVNNANNVTLKKGTLMPWNHASTRGQGIGQSLGMNLTWDFSYNQDLENLTLVSGGNSGTEKRLSLLFSFNDISASDVEATHTNFWGKFSVFIPPQESNNHNIDTNDTFIVSAIATQTVESDSEIGTSANALEPHPDSGYNIISQTGIDLSNISTTGGEFNWDVRDTDQDSLFSGVSSEFIKDWDLPDAFDALSLNFRLTGANTDSYLKINTHIHSIGLLQTTLFKNALNSDFYADVRGRIDANNILIEKPSKIIEDIIVKEVAATKNIGVIENENIGLELNLAFSVKDKITAKTLIQNISLNSNLYPKFDNAFNVLSIAEISKTYNDSNIDMTILAKDIIKFKFSRTSSSDIKTMVNVKYKKDYAEDEYTRETGWCDGYDFYGNSENQTRYSKFIAGDIATTSQVMGYDYSKNGITRESNMYTLESDFIRDNESAIVLRDYIFMLNCNYHNKISLTLPLKYFTLEVGDITNFDSLFNDLKIYGEDYTIPNTRNGQRIYPYFMVTSITKSTKDIKLELYQLHELERTFTAGLGSLSRKSNIGIQSYELHWEYFYGFNNPFDFFQDEFGYIQEQQLESLTNAVEGVAESYPDMKLHLNTTDLNILTEALAGDVSTLTSEQIRNADLHRTGNLDAHDLNVMQIYLEFYRFGTVNQSTMLQQFYNIESISDWNISLDAIELASGDLNQDGNVNVSDIVAMIELIVGSTDPSQEQLIISDLIQDGTINVSDIVFLVDQILGNQ